MGRFLAWGSGFKQPCIWHLPLSSPWQPTSGWLTYLGTVSQHGVRRSVTYIICHLTPDCARAVHHTHYSATSASFCAALCARLQQEVERALIAAGWLMCPSCKPQLK